MFEFAFALDKYNMVIKKKFTAQYDITKFDA